MFIRYILLCFILTFQFSFALSIKSEMLVKTSINNRLFYVADIYGLNVELSYFSQTKGEYQDLISRKNISLNEYNELKKKALGQSYVQKNSISNWSKLENIDDKGLFGIKKKTFIWETKNTWDDSWEKKYSEWIKNNVNSNFYQKYKIQTDCADAVVGFRWIFSRINYLPVANTLAGTGDLFGNFTKSKKFSDLKRAENWYEDEMFLAALNYIMEESSTKTIFNDGHPVSLDQKGLIEGTYIVIYGEGNGHARMIFETHYGEDNDFPIYVISSTTPREVRTLNREAFLDYTWPSKGTREILAFNWPVEKNGEWFLKNDNSYSNYSEQQFDPKLQYDHYNLILYLIETLNSNLSYHKIIQKSVDQLVNLIEQRIQVVNDGYAFCSKNPCPYGSVNFDAWSTPHRDEDLINKFGNLNEIINQTHDIDPDILVEWNTKKNNTFVEIENYHLSLMDIFNLFAQGKTNADPNADIKARWGLK